MRDLRAPRIPLRAQPKLAFLRDQAKASQSPPTPKDNQIASADPIALGRQSTLRVGPLSRVIIGAGATALFITCLYSAYGPASVGDMTATVVMLFSGWLFAVGAFTLSELLTTFSNRHRFLASFSFAVFIAVLTIVWGKTIFREPAPPIQKAGARMFFQVDGFTKDSKKVNVTMTNNGDVIARVATRYGSVYTFSDHSLTEKEEDDRYGLALKSLPSLTNGFDVPVNDPRPMQIDIDMSPAQYDGVVNGTLYFYLFVVAAFSDELTPAGQTNIASVCTHFTKNTTTGLLCLRHTESRVFK